MKVIFNGARSMEHIDISEYCYVVESFGLRRKTITGELGAGVWSRFQLAQVRLAGLSLPIDVAFSRLRSVRPKIDIFDGP